ncbi:MAG: gluconate 2-dehydrogenase subunit 3 family protein [Gemmatimonadaceae bacterium]
MRPETGDARRETAEIAPGNVTRQTTDPVARRDVLKLLAAAPLARFAISYESVELAAAHAGEVLDQAAQRGQRFQPKFFTPDEWRLVRTLSDIIIPRDSRSGSATDGGVPEFMDFIMTAYPDMQKPMRDGLRWMNTASTERFQKPFVDCVARQHTQLLDEIAYPKRAVAAVKDGADFFSRFRDLTASGFWSSRIGVADLQYIGNTARVAWTGCPAAALAKLGVSYG